MERQCGLDFSAPPARARRSDPSTSRQSAARVNVSGLARQQREKVFAMVCETPGLTSAELAERHGADRTMIARRLPELRQCDLVAENRDVRGMTRICNVSKTAALTWWPIR